MEQQTQNQTTSGQQDRLLTITATPTLNWNASGQLTGVTMSYSQYTSTPNMPNMVNPRTGDINLRNMPANNNFTDNVDITINLDDSTAVGPNGAHVAVRFAYPTESNGDGTGPIWFCATPQPGQPKNPAQIPNPPGMSTGENTSSQVYLNDDQPDGGSSYSFCLALVVPSVSGTPITIDPIVSGKGKTSTFMLKQ